jgi:receptor protein-tyrosine kinase
MIEGSEQDQGGIGLRHYLDVLWRRKWIVLAVLAVAIGAAAGLSALQTPIYRAQTKIVIGQGKTLIPPTVLGQANQTLTATMADLAQSNVLARNVVDNLGLKETPEQLLAKISVSINPQTAVMDVFVDDHSQSRARRICQEVSSVFSQLVQANFGKSIPAAGGQPEQPGITATVFDPAHVLPARVAPRPVRNVAIAAVLGLILGLLAAFLREYFDRGLRSREKVEQAFGLPVIGQVPFEQRRRKRNQRAVVWDGFGEIAESYRALRANLQYLAVKRPLRTILVTSASPAQGKTTVTANLALAIARSGASTIALEGDLRRPRLDEAFGVPNDGPGLTSVLVGSAEFDMAVQEVPLPVGRDGSSREVGRLSLLPSGPLPPNPSELLSSMQMRKLLDRLGVSYDYVLIDSPPLLLVADALELARMVDGVVLVVRNNHATTDEARELRALVERLDIHLVGAVFSDIAPLGSYGTYGVYGEDEQRSRERERVAAAARSESLAGDEL